MPHLASTSDRAAASGDAAEPRVPQRFYALKDGDTFLVADAFGDIRGEGDGFFRDDTRVLSGLRLILGGQPPSLLSASVSRDNVFFTSHMTNRPLPLLGGKAAPEGIIHFERTRFLAGERLYERLRCVNYDDRAVSFPLALEFAADFRDMFEVRGTARRTRGRLFPPVAADGAILFRYEGLDGVARETVIAFSEAPARLTPERADFLLTLPASGRAELYLEIGPDRQPQPSRARFRAAGARARLAMRARRRRGAVLRSSGRLFNEWLEKSRADLALLTTELPTGPYPYAGIPWFSTPFGRDAIVTALQTLWLDTRLARGVLNFLARHQAQETSSFRDSAPGKIVHETRKGEMTALSELPFGRYYGGVDTTPLFVMLAGAYAERTGDLAFIDELWPALEAAMGWIESASRANPDGFLVYERGEESGLSNQGWKDSDGAVFHADGRIPEGPIALVEVQGYVFAALRAMGALASRRGDAVAATTWRIRADSLRAGVEERFWIEEAGFYGLAIDGEGALCRAKASNAGHLLYVGLPPADRARRVRDQLLSAAFDSGWGLRTLAPGEPHFNPMSYHNGSVWPHDTALCAAGLARYGERKGVVRLLGGMFEAAVHFGMRLPELFCGFPRTPGEPPIAYPVACLPQAWSAGAIFMMLQACLGLRIDGRHGEIHVDRPHLPVGIDHLAIRGLSLGDKRLDLVFQRIGERVVVLPETRSEDAPPVLVHV
ncbi:MAG: glycogen debranching N-terminal domain-containing protein [Pseudomonadota bacterium]